MWVDVRPNALLDARVAGEMDRLVVGRVIAQVGARANGWMVGCIGR